MTFAVVLTQVVKIDRNLHYNERVIDYKGFDQFYVDLYGYTIPYQIIYFGLNYDRSEYMIEHLI